MSSAADEDGYDGLDDGMRSYYAAVEAKRLRGDTHWPSRPLKPAWRIVQPPPRTAALALAGARARVRRLMLEQVRNAESAAVYRGDEPVALVMFARHGWRRTEMAMAVSRDAAPHMRRLVRMAQLTLFRLAEDRLIVAAVDPFNQAGRRMAMLTGFRPARLKSRFLWVYRRDER